MTCRIIANLSEIAADYDAVFCDIWGCFHNGVAPFPAAVAALQKFRQGGGISILLTNAPRPSASVQKQLDAMDAPRDSYDDIVSSGAACQAALTGGAYGSRFLYVGPDRDLQMLTDVGLTPTPEAEAQAILITGLRDDLTETPEDYASEIARWRDQGLTMLCANPDIVVDRGTVRSWCAGAIAQKYEQAGGKVIWFGKPHLPVYDRCHQVLAEMGLDIPKSRVLAIGDGPATDVPGGINAGLDTLFVTGGLSADLFGGDVENPQQDALDVFLTSAGLAPKYAIGRLR